MRAEIASEALQCVQNHRSKHAQRTHDRKSHAHDLATYAINDNLGSGLVLLLMIPTIALALGTLATRLLKTTPRT